MQDWLDLDWMLTKRLQCHPHPSADHTRNPSVFETPLRLRSILRLQSAGLSQLAARTTQTQAEKNGELI